MATTSALDSRTVAEARDGLERVLNAIREGELTAGPGYVARLEGAIAALNALLSEPKWSELLAGDESRLERSEFLIGKRT